MTRIPQFSALIAASLLTSLFLSSCGSDEAHALPEGAQRARKIDDRVRELQQRFHALEVRDASDRAAHTKIQSSFSAVKIVFKSKEKARLGQITQDRFEQLNEALDEIEWMIDAYPDL